MSRERRGTRLGVGESRYGSIALGTAAWVVGMLWIFPVAWTLLTSFKTEQDASAQTLHHGLSFARYSEISHSTEGTDAARVARRLCARDPPGAQVA